MIQVSYWLSKFIRVPTEKALSFKPEVYYFLDRESDLAVEEKRDSLYYDVKLISKRDPYDAEKMKYDKWILDQWVLLVAKMDVSLESQILLEAKDSTFIGRSREDLHSIQRELNMPDDKKGNFVDCKLKIKGVEEDHSILFKGISIGGK